MVMCTVLKEGTIVYANTEMDAISHGGKTFEAAGIQVEDGENPEGAFSDCTSLKKFDFSDVKGQENAKRALEIAATGSHNCLLCRYARFGKKLIIRKNSYNFTRFNI